MTPEAPARGRRRLLLVGGSGGLLGRAVLPAFAEEFTIRSLHRYPTSQENGKPVEWVEADAGLVTDWAPIVRDVDVVVNLAWYRWGSEREFRTLYRGLARLVQASRNAGVRRFLQVSVPAAPERLERELPYLSYKRRLDAEIASSGLSYRILRPTMMFAERDVLLTVMLGTVDRYHRFPMFGDGSYHASPIASADVARLLRLESDREGTGTVDLGGPRRFEYRELTDLLFSVLGLPPRYFAVSPENSLRLAHVLQGLGSTLLYAYEVEWLMSDLLGLAPAEGLDRPLTPLEPFLREQASRLR